MNNDDATAIMIYGYVMLPVFGDVVLAKFDDYDADDYKKDDYGDYDYNDDDYDYADYDNYIDDDDDDPLLR